MARPSMADTPAEVEAILRSLPGRFRAEVAGDLRATYHWEVKNADKPKWTVRIEAGSCEVQEGWRGEPDCVVRMTQKTFVAVETGERNPMMAFLKGKIRISNVGAMRRYDQAFFKFHDVPDS